MDGLIVIIKPLLPSNTLSNGTLATPAGNVKVYGPKS